MAKNPSQVQQSAQNPGDQVVEEHRRIKQSLEMIAEPAPHHARVQRRVDVLTWRN